MQAQQLTTSRQTSETPQEPPLQTVDAICEKHGAYKAKVLDMTGIGGKKMVMHCHHCGAEERAKDEARKIEEAARARRHRVEALAARSGIPARFADRKFENYRAAEQGQKIALGVCRAYADKWDEKSSAGGSLVLTGGPGTGKTHLACAIGNAVIESSLSSVLFLTIAGMLRAIKDTYRKGSERSEQQAINDFSTPDLLILDEVGVQVGSDHEKLLMFEVLNNRYQDMRPTILISNLPADELEAFLGQRVMDRYRECGSVLAFNWASHRGLK
ncbi:MAG: ATP-binding protein [Stenotrophomonas sp.]